MLLIDMWIISSHALVKIQDYVFIYINMLYICPSPAPAEFTLDSPGNVINLERLLPCNVKPN